MVFRYCIAQVTEEIAVLEQRLDNARPADGTPFASRDIRAHTGFFATLLAKELTLARLRKNSCALLRKITDRRMREMKRLGPGIGVCPSPADIRRLEGKQSRKTVERPFVRKKSEILKGPFDGPIFRTAAAPGFHLVFTAFFQRSTE